MSRSSKFIPTNITTVTPQQLEAITTGLTAAGAPEGSVKFRTSNENTIVIEIDRGWALELDADKFKASLLAHKDAFKDIKVSGQPAKPQPQQPKPEVTAETAGQLQEALGLDDPNRFELTPKTGTVGANQEPVIIFKSLKDKDGHPVVDVGERATRIQAALDAYDKAHGTHLGQISIIAEKGGDSISFKTKEMTPQVVQQINAAMEEYALASLGKRYDAQLKKSNVDFGSVADSVTVKQSVEFRESIEPGIEYKLKTGVDAEEFAKAFNRAINNPQLNKKFDIAYDKDKGTITISKASLDDPYVQQNMGKISAALQEAVKQTGKQPSTPSMSQPAVQPAVTLSGAGSGIANAIAQPQPTQPPVSGTKQNNAQFDASRQGAVQGNARPLTSGTAPVQSEPDVPKEPTRQAVQGHARPLTVGGTAPVQSQPDVPKEPTRQAVQGHARPLTVGGTPSAQSQPEVPKEPARQAVQGNARPLTVGGTAAPSQPDVPKEPARQAVQGHARPLTVGGTSPAPSQPEVPKEPARQAVQGNARSLTSGGTAMTSQESNLVAMLKEKGLTYDKPSATAPATAAAARAPSSTALGTDRGKDQGEGKGGR
jgi:hypothetical protein